MLQPAACRPLCGSASAQSDKRGSSICTRTNKQQQPNRQRNTVTAQRFRLCCCIPQTPCSQSHILRLTGNSTTACVSAHHTITPQPHLAATGVAPARASSVCPCRQPLHTQALPLTRLKDSLTPARLGSRVVARKGCGQDLTHVGTPCTQILRPLLQCCAELIWVCCCWWLRLGGEQEGQS